MIRAEDEAARYAGAPVVEGEFSDAEDPLGWDADGWAEFANKATEAPQTAT